MGDHPPTRVAVFEPAFTHTGIDYYGPFKVSTGTHSKTRKVWGIIFTCLICRVVHLDIVGSLSMDAWLNGIERFMLQYADVTIAFYSDNGTNFRGTVSFGIFDLALCELRSFRTNFAGPFRISITSIQISSEYTNSFYTNMLR